MLIYKIFRPAEWAALQRDGETAGAPVDLADGFVHFSTAEQVAETAARHFADEEGLELLAVRVAQAGADLHWETSRGGALFPHLFRPLRMEDVLWHTSLPLEAGAHRFPAGLSGQECFIDPDRAQFEAFKSQPRDTEIQMLNLVRFRAQARYPGDHPRAGDGLSGAEAYALYGRDSAPVLARVGGDILWRGAFEATLIGPLGEDWDAMFIARYPNAGAFLAMVTDLDYRRAVVHRQAAVETSRLIRTAPCPGGEGFA